MVDEGARSWPIPKPPGRHRTQRTRTQKPLRVPGETATRPRPRVPGSRPALMTSRSRRKRPCTQDAASVRSFTGRDGSLVRDPLPREEFVAALRAQGARYWDKHPFHGRLHEGGCTQGEVQAWVANRWYYQRNLSQKNGAIIAHCPLPEVRRRWVERITFQDGTPDGAGGGLEDWLLLAEAVGLTRQEVQEEQHRLPGVPVAVEYSV